MKQIKSCVVVGVQKEAVAEMRKAIMDILKSGADKSSVNLALEVLKDKCTTQAYFSNCQFTGDLPKERT